MAGPVKEPVVKQFPRSNITFRWWIEPFSGVVITEQMANRFWRRKNRPFKLYSRYVDDPEGKRDGSNPTGRLACHDLTVQEIAEIHVVSKNPREFIWRINSRSYDETQVDHREW